jgi:hypothetical protein
MFARVSYAYNLPFPLEPTGVWIEGRAHEEP